MLQNYNGVYQGKVLGVQARAVAMLLLMVSVNHSESMAVWTRSQAYESSSPEKNARLKNISELYTKKIVKMQYFTTIKNKQK